ncbi:FMN-linked oxidoreductase [Xylariaceae sp. FL0255]|nr:FMN-linked oxidoreductase [Xylariaceae sp. FL0255]
MSPETRITKAHQCPVAGPAAELCSTEERLINHGAPNISYFTPVQDPPAGTTWDEQLEGSLFSPLQINGMKIHSRIIVSPMCQYSAKDGFMTMWHQVHLGSFAKFGAGLVITEATAVSPEGRISPQDLGLWDNAHVAPIKSVVEFVHSQGSKFGIQLAHAGRKASTVAPWVDRKAAARNYSEGWPQKVLGPSSEAYSEQTIIPQEATVADLDKFKDDWASAVKRALQAGVDTIEVHAAHGYILNEFLSPSSNKRTDQYGGSLENRARLLIEILDLTRSIVPPSYPVLVRMPATDYLETAEPSVPREEQWTIDDAIELAKMLVAHSADLLDISGGGTDARQHITPGPEYQVKFATAIKNALEESGSRVVPVGTVGEITSGVQAQGILEGKQADAIIVGRAFLKNPALVWTWADELGLDIHVPSQYGWGFGMTRTHRKRSH